MIQKIYKNTDLLFSIEIGDNNNIIDIADIGELTMLFYTDSTPVENHIFVTKNDIINNNQIFIDNTKLDLLNEGLLKYNIKLRFNNTSIDEPFDISKDVETTYFIKNDNYNDGSCTGGTTDSYSKSEIDLKLSLKANVSDIFNKSEINSMLSTKANKSDLPDISNLATKDELKLKANTNDVYSKSEVDEKIADTGTVDLSSYYKKTEVDDKLSVKVDAVEGKQLSANDYTDADKTKLQSLNNYDDTSIKQSLSDKQDKLVSSVNIKTINNQSLLGTGNITISGGDEPVDLSNYYDKDEVNALLTDKASISDISSLATKTELAGKADAADVYTKSQTYSKSEVNDLIDNIETSGTTVDLTNYYKKDEVNTLLANKADTSTIATMATKTELATKANSSDVYSKDELYTKTEVDKKLSDIQPGTGGTASIETYILRWDETQATEEHAQLYTKLLNMFYYDESINVFFNALDGTAEYIININNIYKDNSATRNEIKLSGSYILSSSIFHVEIVLKKDGSFTFTKNNITINNLADLSTIENRVTSLESEITNPTNMTVDCLNYE